MITNQYVSLMAAYNEWINARLYAAAAKLPEAEIVKDRKAFFGSLLGTLNHIVVGDTIWLKRFSKHPANHASLDPVRALPTPAALDERLFSDLESLRARRTMLDTVIRKWANELEAPDLSHVLTYVNMKGVGARKPLASLLVQFFNHQTHHRGQATALLSQAGEDVGVTDVLALMPDVARE